MSKMAEEKRKLDESYNELTKTTDLFGGSLIEGVKELKEFKKQAI